MSFFEKLKSEMNQLSNWIYETPEFKSLDEVKLTIERARFYAAHTVYFNMNRRDCWDYVQGAVPWEVKRVIWKHEEDELISDRRGGADHRSLLSGKRKRSDFLKTRLKIGSLTQGCWRHFTPGYKSPRTNIGWSPLPRLIFLNAENDTSVVKCETSPMRRKKKFIEELGIKEDLLISTNVHTVADVDHTKMIEEVFENYVNTEESLSLALRGARDSLTIERGYRAALAAGMQRLS